MAGSQTPVYPLGPARPKASGARARYVSISVHGRPVESPESVSRTSVGCARRHGRPKAQRGAHEARHAHSLGSAKRNGGGVPGHGPCFAPMRSGSG